VKRVDANKLINDSLLDTRDYIDATVEALQKQSLDDISVIKKETLGQKEKMKALNDEFANLNARLEKIEQDNKVCVSGKLKFCLGQKLDYWNEYQEFDKSAGGLGAIGQDGQREDISGLETSC
jgi:hypothetical protein